MHFACRSRTKYNFFSEGEIYFQPGATSQADEPLGFQSANGTFRGHSAECPYRYCAYLIVY